MMKRYVLLLGMGALACDEDPLVLRAARGDECDGRGGVVLTEGDELYFACNGEAGTLQGPPGEPGRDGAPGEPGPPGTAATTSPLALGDLQGSVACAISAQTNLGAPYTQRAKTWFFSSGWTFSTASLGTDADDESQSDFAPPGANPTFSFSGLPVLVGLLTYEMDISEQLLEVRQGATVIATLLWAEENCVDARM